MSDELTFAEKRIAQLEILLARRSELLDRRQQELDTVKSSHAYRFAHSTQKIVDRFFPLYTRRRTWLKKSVRLMTFPARWLWQRRQAKNGPAMQDRFQLDMIPVEEYHRWIKSNEPSGAELQKQKQQQFAYRPKISIVVPVYNPPAQYLREMIESVFRQTYAHWQLCIADASNAENRERLQAVYHSFANDIRMTVKTLPENQGIAGNSNAALGLADGDFITFLDHDDTLAPFALHELAKAINANRKADLLYSDEDKLDRTGQRCDPLFKPNWSPDTLRSRNYFCHLTALSRNLLEEIGPFQEGFNGAQDYDLFFRASEQADEIVHIPSVLYHWRAHEGSTAAHSSAKNYAFDSGQKAIEAHLKRIGQPGQVYQTSTAGTYRIQYELKRRPKVSVIIPNKNLPDMLARCVDSVLNSTYENVELIIVENGSTDPATHALYGKLNAEKSATILEWTQPFNYAAVNNFAANHATGELLLFLNNDMEMIDSDWLESLVRYAVQPGVGAVGAKLLFPDDTIQHAGVVVGMGGVAGHGQAYFPATSPGYHQKLLFTQNVAAVTGACLMVPRHVFDRVNGFDEGFVLAFNDVDLCLQILNAKYRIIWTPDAKLYHYESKTRGAEDTAEKQMRFKREYDLFMTKWSQFLKQGDPYYSPHFRLDRADIALKAA